MDKMKHYNTKEYTYISIRYSKKRKLPKLKRNIIKLELDIASLIMAIVLLSCPLINHLCTVNASSSTSSESITEESEKETEAEESMTMELFQYSNFIDFNTINETEEENNVETGTSETEETETTTEEPVIEYRYTMTDKEFKMFVRCVEAEVTGDHPKGISKKKAYKSKLHVAQVILNRIESPKFPNTVKEVIFQKNAFTPILDGRYWEVEISDITIKACKDALLASTEDTTQGCEFFSSNTDYCKYGYKVFTDDVNHTFFKSYDD